jgi:hypothetical protein
LVVFVGVDVAVRLGFGEGVGVLVLSRLGCVVRVGRGVGLFVVVRVGVGVGVVRRGVYDGLVGRTGVALAGASSAAVTSVTGVSWPVTLPLPVSRRTNHPRPASRTRAEKEASRGPATP